MSAHPLVAAARELQKDELRRRRRGQRTRLDDSGASSLDAVLEAVGSPVSAEGIGSPEYRAGRGRVAVEVFDYRDDFDEVAATVITDILHAAVGEGYSPQHILDQAAAYYAEEI